MSDRSYISYIPLLSKEGCSRHQTECREATLWGANGVVLIEPRSAPFFIEVTNHPVCALKEWDLLLMAQPPLLEKEGNVL
jgi:hypothetical protein